ncbi:MAG: hypothetical protein SGPRY_004753 [Prymnesium sp.]
MAAIEFGWPPSPPEMRELAIRSYLQAEALCDAGDLSAGMRLFKRAYAQAQRRGPPGSVRVSVGFRPVSSLEISRGRPEGGWAKSRAVASRWRREEVRRHSPQEPKRLDRVGSRRL